MFIMVDEIELHQMYIRELTQYRDIITSVSCANIPVFSSIISRTRSGGTNPTLRARDDGALPVRVPLMRTETINLNDYNDMRMKRYERQLRAKAYRTLRFKRKY